MNFCIVLARGDAAVYRPGSVVEGSVILQLSSRQNIKGISIVFSGKAHVKWRPSDTVTVLGDTSRYMRQLLGNGRDLQRLTAGRYVIPFSFRLPIELPTSYYKKASPTCCGTGSKGYIRYSLTATMVRLWKANLNATRDIQVKDFVKTNTPQLSIPLSAQSQRVGSHFCCGSGLITMSVETDRGGYCPGESIAFTVKVENIGNRRIKGVIVTLRQSTIYHAGGGRSYSHSQTVKTVRGPGAGPRGEINWNDGLLVPETTPTISNCRIIRLSYELVVQISVAFARKLSVVIPIVIGTELFRTERLTSATASPSHPSATNPEFGSEQPGISTHQLSATNPSYQGEYPDSSVPVPSTINPEFMSFPRQQLNAESARPSLNTRNDQEIRETAFAPMSDLVTNYISDQPPSYDSIFNK